MKLSGEEQWTPGKIRNKSGLHFYLVEYARKLYQQFQASAKKVERKEPKPCTVLLSSQKRHSVDVSRPRSPAEGLPVVTSKYAMQAAGSSMGAGADPGFQKG